MHTLENLLPQNQLPAIFEAGLRHMRACSPFATRLLLSDAHLLQDLLQNHLKNYHIAQMQLFLSAASISDEPSLKKALRQLRQRVLLNIIYRDLNGLASLDEVLETISNLAELALNTAAHYWQTWLALKHGNPLTKIGAPQPLIIIGMGKLGGRELNVSSDIDLIFTYADEGETNSTTPISHQDFFTLLAKKLISAMDEVTADGFVFRVDMRLRPFGSEGLLVSSLEALENYYQENGREWERYAWIKGRVLNDNMHASAALQANTYAALRPFIFRKYLDFNALNSMRDLKLQIHRDVLQKGMQDNIKLGQGGIREIEFIAQVFQLIRGGQDASLQIKPTLSVLNLLKNKGLLPEKTVHALTNAYVFLRNLEHRLMYVEDQQTQELPKSEDAKARIALAMGFRPDENNGWDAFLQTLNAHRQQVAMHFEATFSDKNQEKSQFAQESAIWQGLLAKEPALQALLHAGYSDAEQTLSRLQMLHASNRYQHLPELSRQRFDLLMPLLIAQSAQQKNADEALLRSIHLLENICRRASYLALLAEFPQALHLVVKLCAASPWLAQYLAAHPILLDELLDTQTLYAAPNFALMQADLSQKMQDLTGNIEAQMDAMRHFKHSAVLRFAAQDVMVKLPLETLSDYLSALADVVLQVSVHTIWQTLQFKHQQNPQFAIIGYGKLGSKELGYLSDLDIIFLYDDAHPDASEIYARFAQRINNWFNSLTNAGLLYETDLQLRPDGNSGLLVSSVTAFREYQVSKAWVWEHQALTRARFVAGDATIGAAFEQIRIEVITQTRDTQALKTQSIKTQGLKKQGLKKEVAEMREKMRTAHPAKANQFDIKHDKGGIIDVEFLVQYLVLAHANQYPQLTDNIGNIGLLNLLSTLKVIDHAMAKKVADAYREYRRLQHALKLQGSPNMRVAASVVNAQMVDVQALWQQIFAD